MTGVLDMVNLLTEASLMLQIANLCTDWRGDSPIVINDDTKKYSAKLMRI